MVSVYSFSNTSEIKTVRELKPTDHQPRVFREKVTENITDNFSFQEDSELVYIGRGVFIFQESIRTNGHYTLQTLIFRLNIFNVWTLNGTERIGSVFNK